MKTKVVFRKFKDFGDIIALFPYEKADTYSNLCTSYMRVGQHDAADYTHCIKYTIPAKPKEYKALKQELERIGYNLTVIKRKT